MRHTWPICTDGRTSNRQINCNLKATYVQDIEVLDQDALPW